MTLNTSNIEEYTKDISTLNISSLEEELRDIEDELMIFFDIYKNTEDKIFNIVAKRYRVCTLLQEKKGYAEPPF